MDVSKAWVLYQRTASDKDLTEIRGALNCETLEISLPVSNLSEIPVGEPEVVIVDLRNDADWPTFRDAYDAIEKDLSCSVHFVAVIDDGIPLEWAEWADQLFSSIVSPPFSGQADQAFRLPEQASKRTDTGFGQRALETESFRYFTHTPELFPVLDDLTIAARHGFAILLIGETGTGKTTLARAIHDLSPRKDERFLTVGCGALPSELIDSELFGHVKGAFTGADRTKEGKFEAAQGGTILLDEIDVLGLEQQAKLLRVLETGEYEPVGSNETRTSSARVIVASNVGVDELKGSGRFRPDLYYRLNQVKFEIPPLRKRLRDIVPLAMLMIKECCREHSLTISKVAPSFMDMLRLYDWPGNIRELRNEVRRSVLFSRDGVIRADSFSPDLKAAIQVIRNSHAKQATLGLAGEVAHTEQEVIEQMLQTQKYNRAATARALGISRVTLYNKIRKYKIRIDSNSGQTKR